jgi:hypothetical protein
MVAIAGPGLCENERQFMNQKPKGSITSVETRKQPLPVKVRLKRLNCNEAMPYPPDGQARDWWQRLRNAFGTASSAFVQASLYQLIAAARLPGSGISEIAVNASLALIEGAKPQGEIEAALVLQMACTHAAAMSVLGTFAGVRATQVETLRRLRNGGSQIVRVEHVHVNEGGQALIGNVRKDGSARAEGER